MKERILEELKDYEIKVNQPKMDRELNGFLKVEESWIEAFGTANTKPQFLHDYGDFL